MATRFLWTGETTVTRAKGGGGGLTLEKGKTYDLADFDGAVVQEWVMTGHAAWEPVADTTLPAPHDTVLEVHNATMKVHAPKVGAVK